jgi:hypothetical protein
MKVYQLINRETGLAYKGTRLKYDVVCGKIYPTLGLARNARSNLEYPHHDKTASYKHNIAEFELTYTGDVE